MNYFNSTNVIYTACVAMLIICGAALIWLGLPKRRGHARRCPHCGNQVKNTYSGPCPKCRRILTSATVASETGKGRDLIALMGALLLTAAIVLLSPNGRTMVRQIDWRRHLPAFMLVWDLSSPEGSRLSFAELMRREEGGLLSASTRKSLATKALNEQAAATPGPMREQWMTYLDMRAQKNDLTEKHRDRFYRQMLDLSLACRKKVARGDLVPVLLDGMGRGPSPTWWVSTLHSSLTIDGQPAVTPRATGLSSHGFFRMMVTTPLQNDLAPGRHTLQGVWHTKFYHGTMANADESQLMHTRDIRLSTTFEMLVDRPPDHIREVRGPAMDEAMRLAFFPQKIICGRPKKNRLTLVQHIEAHLPAALSCDILVRYDGREYPLTTVVMPKDRPKPDVWTMNAMLDGPLPKTLDVIYRSNQDVASRSVDIDEIWAGELVFENVPVLKAGL